ncbi:hypothetical protein [Devosia aurantiaca]|uniref:Uncharacterized protein n=1 Tax=Devosia aurantiaca TaxID=2714858 RepID=A0A6M1SW35_9HYPH|nr:hypothetical protein [Devosia aurantiaca]NGP17161.1 hypothetical protein [Devosia aurantiaca]
MPQAQDAEKVRRRKGDVLVDDLEPAHANFGQHFDARRSRIRRWKSRHLVEKGKVCPFGGPPHGLALADAEIKTGPVQGISFAFERLIECGPSFPRGRGVAHDGLHQQRCVTRHIEAPGSGHIAADQFPQWPDNTQL